MLTFGFAENSLLLTDIVPNMPQLLDNSKPLRTRLSEPVIPPPYPERAYQWLTEVLDGLIDFGKRHGHYGVINLSKGEYQWLMDDVLEELICSVGEDENHPLAPLMEFVMRLIDNYEDAYVPKLTELFPELAEEAPIGKTNENNNPPRYASELSENELAAHAFFSIGCLLWEGGKAEKALDAYDTAIRLQPDYAEVYNNRGNIKNGLGCPDDAVADYDTAIRLNPHFAEAYYNRGTQKVLCEELDAAIVDYTEAIRIKPDYAEVYVNRGIAKVGLNRIDEAESDFQIALELAEQQGDDTLKTPIAERLQDLNNSTPPDDEN